MRTDCRSQIFRNQTNLVCKIFFGTVGRWTVGRWTVGRWFWNTPSMRPGSTSDLAVRCEEEAPGMIEYYFRHVIWQMSNLFVSLIQITARNKQISKHQMVPIPFTFCATKSCMCSIICYVFF